MASKASAIAEKMRKPEEIRALLQTLESDQRIQKSCDRSTTELDSNILILKSVLQTIDTQSKQGATNEEAILEGARKVIDITLQLRKETLAFPQIGQDTYRALPAAEQVARQLLVARSRTLLWVMGQESGKDEI